MFLKARRSPRLKPDDFSGGLIVALFQVYPRCFQITVTDAPGAAPVAGSACPDGDDCVVAREGESLLLALQRTKAPILSICGGHASCGACRIEIQANWFERLTPADRTEANLLDCLDGAAANHRLACQVLATASLNGLRLKLAPSI